MTDPHVFRAGDPRVVRCFRVEAFGEDWIGSLIVDHPGVPAGAVVVLILPPMAGAVTLRYRGCDVIRVDRAAVVGKICCCRNLTDALTCLDRVKAELLEHGREIALDPSDPD